MATLSRELAFPLSIDASGGLSFYTSPADKAAAHVELILGTELGERLMIADYGARTLEHLFDEISDERLADIERDVAEALAAWGDDITVHSIDATAVDNQVVVSVVYALNQSPDTNQTTSVTLQVQAG